MDSILDSVKKKLGINPEYEYFDQDIIMDINTAFSILRQLGVGPKTGFRIEGSGDVWSDFISKDSPIYEAVKTYICQKVRMTFDPPTSSVMAEAVNRSISELEWRLNVTAEFEEGG